MIYDFVCQLVLSVMDHNYFNHQLYVVKQHCRHY